MRCSNKTQHICHPQIKRTQSKAWGLPGWREQRSFLFVSVPLRQLLNDMKQPCWILVCEVYPVSPWLSFPQNVLLSVKQSSAVQVKGQRPRTVLSFLFSFTSQALGKNVPVWGLSGELCSLLSPRIFLRRGGKWLPVACSSDVTSGFGITQSSLPLLN